jgi:hypothetical protein
MASRSSVIHLAGSSLLAACLVLTVAGCSKDDGPSVGVDSDASNNNENPDQGGTGGDDTGGGGGGDDAGRGMDASSGEDTGASEDAGSGGDDMGGTDMATGADAAADTGNGDDTGNGVEYTLTVDIFGQGTGDVDVVYDGGMGRCFTADDQCTYRIPDGANVTLTPFPGPDSAACAWSLGPCKFSEGTCDFTMNRDMIASISFATGTDLCP